MPIIFCNGTDDGLVPFWTGEMSAKILKLCSYSKVEFYGYQRQGHSTNCDKELYNFLERILPRKIEENEEGNNFDYLPKSKKPRIEGEPVENDNSLDNLSKEVKFGGSENSTNNSFPTAWIISGGILVLIIGLVALFIGKNNKNIDDKEKRKN